MMKRPLSTICPLVIYTCPQLESTKEMTLSAYNRGLSISTLNEHISLGPTGGVQGQRGIGISAFRSNLYPIEDGGANLGLPNRRWLTGYIRYMVTGDLAFTEQTCAICGERFGDGDILALLTKTILEDGHTYTIPIHERCKDVEKTLEIEVPEMTIKYRVNDHGEVEPYKTPAFEEVGRRNSGESIQTMSWTKTLGNLSVSSMTGIGSFIQRMNYLMAFILRKEWLRQEIRS